MAVAIKRDAVQTVYRDLAQKYSDEGRTAMKLTCPELNCGQEYVVYFEARIDEAHTRDSIEPYLTRDHPDHRDVYAADEPMPKL
jgi:hypothetical protein